MLIVLLLQLTTSLASLCSFSSPKAQPKENGGNVVNTGDREERRGSTVSGSAHTVAGYSLSFSRRALASAAARAHCVCLSLCVYCVWKTERKRGARIHRHEPPMLCLPVCVPRFQKAITITRTTAPAAAAAAALSTETKTVDSLLRNGVFISSFSSPPSTPVFISAHRLFALR